jgi:hypothetical protein
MSSLGNLPDLIRMALMLIGLVMAVWLVYSLRDIIHGTDQNAKKNKGGTRFRR